jgi:hypothetical protein
MPCLQTLDPNPSHLKGRGVRRQLVAGRRAAAHREQHLAQPPGLLAPGRLLSRAPHQKHVRAQLRTDMPAVVGSHEDTMLLEVCATDEVLTLVVLTRS